MVAMVALLICYYYATHILHTFVVGIKILASMNTSLYGRGLMNVSVQHRLPLSRTMMLRTYIHEVLRWLPWLVCYYCATHTLDGWY